MLHKIHSKKHLKIVFLITFGLFFFLGIFSLSDTLTKVKNTDSYITRLVRTTSTATGSFSKFFQHLQTVEQAIKNGQISNIEILTSIKSLGQGTKDIYDRIAQALIAEYNHNPKQILIEEDPVIRHDMPGVLYLVKKFKDKFKQDNPLIYVSDGGFNTRAGIKTLAYGHQGPISLPGGNTFRDLLFRLGMGIQQSLSEDMEGDYMVWLASDNFLSPGNINWNGEPLSEIPEDAKMILSGAKTQLLNADEMGKISQLIEQGKSWKQIKEEVNDKNNPSFSHFREVVKEEKIKELGVFAVNPDTGTVSGFKEKEKNLGELAKFAYQKGDGAVYKNAFVNLVNKDLLVELQEKLSDIKSVNPALNKSGLKLSGYSLSWYQSMLQGRFVDEKEWLQIKIKDYHENVQEEIIDIFKHNPGIIQENVMDKVTYALDKIAKDSGLKKSELYSLIDWVNYRRVLEDIIEKKDLYAVDLDVGDGKNQGFWYDAGNLKVLNQVLGSVVHENPNIRNKARQVLGIPTDKNVFNLDLKDKSKVQYDGDNYYVENVRINGGGTLVIEDGVVLKDVYLNIPEGERLVITPDSKIIESDLRGVNVKFEGRNGVIDRYFPHGEKDLRINGFEWVSSIKVGERVITARNPILLPFKGKTVQQIAIDMGEEILGKNATNANKAIRGWKELNHKYPQLFGEYQYNEIKDKQLIQLDNLNGNDFMDALLKLIDFEWMYENVNKLQSIVGP